MTNLKELSELLQELEDQDLMEDRSEYDVEDLMKAYDLDHHDASTLYLCIRGRTIGSEHDMYRLDKDHSKALLEAIQESIHQWHDGWEDEEKIIIEAFLSDIAWAARQTYKDNQERK